MELQISLLETKKKQFFSKLRELGPDNIPAKFSDILQAGSILSSQENGLS